MSGNTVICMRVANAKEHVQGCIVEVCADCKSDCWVSPTSQAMGYSTVLCVPCVSRRADLKAASVEIAPGAVEEIQQHFLRKRRN